MAAEEELDLIFSALSHGARRAVVRALGERGELTFTEMMQAAGIGETGTFGFHLKRLAPLLERTEGGKYRLSRLGRLAYSILGYASEGRVPREAGAKVLSGLEECVIDQELLKSVDVLEVVNCRRVVVANDVDQQLFRKRVGAIRNAEEVWVPKHLYYDMFRKLEGSIGRVEVYEGKLGRAPSRVLENYSRLTLDCSQIKGLLRVINYGQLTLRNVGDDLEAKLRIVGNYGRILVPKGFMGIVCRVVEENYGPIEEYEEGGGDERAGG